MDNESKLALLKSACRRARLDFDDLISQCRSGEAQFWQNDDACAITGMTVSAGHKVCYVIVLGGTASGYRALLPTIENFAKEAGCQAVRGAVRPGILRHLAKNSQGYKPILTMVEKVLEA